MSNVEFRYLELPHYDNAPHFRRYARRAAARRREATVLLPGGVDPQGSFDAFVDRVTQAVESRTYLPIARFCDGEYAFYAGRETTTCWGEQRSNLRLEGVEALHVEALGRIACKGFLAPNLNLCYLGVQSEFLGFLASRGMPLQNYVPFYYVYALLVNPRFLGALRGRRLTLVSSFANKNQARLLATLEAAGVTDVACYEIPASGVAHGHFELDISERPDAILVGAGIGSPLVLDRLRTLECPVIDAGFVFHLWDGTYDRYERLFLNYC